MKARLSVSCKTPFEIFYNTACEFEYFGSNAQITYIEEADKANQVLVQLGVSNQKLVIVRTTFEGSVTDGKNTSSEVKILSSDSFKNSRVMFSFDTLDVFLHSAGLKTSIGENFVKLSVPCCFGNGELKTDKTVLTVNCKVLED